MLNLRQARELVNASQKRLADAARLNVNVVADLEQGKNKRPSHEVVVRLVRGLQRLGAVGMTADLIEEFHVPDDDAALTPEEAAS